MRQVFACPGQCATRTRIFVAFVLAFLLAPIAALAAPYADYVIDIRTGEVLHQQNADTRLHPASLTKVMTLFSSCIELSTYYVVFIHLLPFFGLGGWWLHLKYFNALLTNHRANCEPPAPQSHHS